MLMDNSNNYRNKIFFPRDNEKTLMQRGALVFCLSAYDFHN